MISDEEKLAEIIREIKMRQVVYPRQVADGKMKLVTADRRIAVMEAIAADYREIVARGKLI